MPLPRRQSITRCDFLGLRQRRGPAEGADPGMRSEGVLMNQEYNHAEHLLSYARGDDVDPFDPATSFVAGLHRDLTARGFEFWFDRMAMSSRGLTCGGRGG